MIAAKEHLGDFERAKLSRLGVHGVLKKSRARVRLFNKRVRVAHKTLEETRDGLSQDHRGNLTAVEDVVADRELDDLNPGATVVLSDARIDTLVAPACDDDLIGVREFLHSCLSQRCSRGCRNRENTT